MLPLVSTHRVTQPNSPIENFGLTIWPFAATAEVLPKRWIVEGTFGWLNRYRRMSKDYEVYTEMSKAMIYGSLIRLMLKPAVA